MQLKLPGDVNDFVKRLVTQGRFDSEQAAVMEGVRLLMNREKLRAEIQQAVEQIERGDWSDEKTVFDELEAEINAA